MSRVVVIARHPQRSAADDVASGLAALARDRGADVIEVSDLDSDPDRLGAADLVVAVGGDGTVLRVVRALGGSGTPVLGVNVGLLGYLTQVQPEDAADVLAAWLEDGVARDLWIDERGLLDVEVSRVEGQSIEVRHLCLNEVVLDRHESGRTVRIRVDIDGETFATYSADGVIVASPTGSTAYSLSARGPVLSPRVKALLVTPVSPHMLFDRSLVLSWQEEVSMIVAASRPARLALDGIALGLLSEGDRVTVRGSSSTARFVRADRAPFHGILRTKFGLGGQ